MMQKYTLKDLAKLLNVSVSTVSKSLNDSPEISTETRDRVKELALLNNYIPNGMAQSLKARETKTIGVIIPNVLDSFFAKALDGIETMASSLGYRIIICISNDSTKKEAESLSTFLSARVDGLIISLAKETQRNNDFSHIMKVINYGIPVVLFDRITTQLPCDYVSIDDFQIAKKATLQMYQSGCKQIAYLSTIYDTSVDFHRKKGYLAAMKGINVKPCIIHIKDYGVFEKNLLSALKRNSIDGILAADELSAIFTIRSVIKNGYKIPEEISVIGFTNGFMGEKFLPSLTTVEQYAGKQGKLSVETLIARIRGELTKEKISTVLESKILYRDSTKALEKL